MTTWPEVMYHEGKPIFKMQGDRVLDVYQDFTPVQWAQLVLDELKRHERTREQAMSTLRIFGVDS